MLGVLSRNEFLFAGEQWDADMGMYYNRARYYDVENGRFNAQDSWEGRSRSPITLNKYLYTHGNPVSGSGYFNLMDLTTTQGAQKTLLKISGHLKSAIQIYNGVQNVIVFFEYVSLMTNMASAVTKTGDPAGYMAAFQSFWGRVFQE